MFLAITEPGLATASAATSALIAVLALALALTAFRAASRRPTRGLRAVGAAFVVFATKNVFSAYNVWTHDVPHDMIELVLSIFDLILIVILITPLFPRRAG